jgi:hypothetical protein
VPTCAGGTSRHGTLKEYAGACLSCSPGKYKPDAATWDTPCTPCSNCTAGTYRAGCGGASVGNCDPCPQGLYKEETHAGPCVPCSSCDSGTYNHGDGLGDFMAL